MLVQFAVDMLTECGEELFSGQVLEFVEPGVDGSSTMVVNSSFIAQDASLHVVKVVLTAFLKGRVIAFLLELLCLQVL